ncbi:diguanylate cyclase [Roseibium salinum]|nr:diguanylate cyclase [Roseibium salinum]
MPQSALLDIGASAFAVVDGTPALLSAMPVLPDEGTVELHADYPAILVNAVYLDEDWIAELNEQLSFRELGFYPGPPERRHPTNYLIRADDGKIFGYLRWDHAKPGREIWVTALPLIILLVSLIAVVAFALASKISRLSASLEESERKNHHFARHDALTGLPNRHHFSDCLAYSLDCLPEQEFAILACDLDRFKPVNDTHGHEAGDTVICSVAQRLRLLVGKHGIVSRIGGDEFIILLTGQTGRDHLASLAEQIGETVAGPIEIGSGQVVEIGVSIGIAIAPDCGSTEKELIRMADLALYKAKDNGRNGFEFAGPPSCCRRQHRTENTSCMRANRNNPGLNRPCNYSHGEVSYSQNIRTICFNHLDKCLFLSLISTFARTSISAGFLRCSICAGSHLDRIHATIPRSIREAPPRQHISRLAFLLAGMLIALTAASLTFVGFVASRASTEQAIANEQRLFSNTLTDRVRALVREQLIVTYSDESVKKTWFATSTRITPARLSTRSGPTTGTARSC